MSRFQLPLPDPMPLPNSEKLFYLQEIGCHKYLFVASEATKLRCIDVASRFACSPEHSYTFGDLQRLAKLIKEEKPSRKD